MRSQLSVWCVQAVPVSGCGVGDYSSVTRWMVVGVVCVGRDVIVWQFYWIVLRQRCHTVHQMSAGPEDNIRGAGRGLAQNWCVVDQTPCFWQSLSSFCQLRRNFDDGRPSAEEHSRWQVNRVQIRAIRCTKWTAGSHAASFCVSGGVRGSTVLLQWLFISAVSYLDVW